MSRPTSRTRSRSEPAFPQQKASGAQRRRLRCFGAYCVRLEPRRYPGKAAQPRKSGTHGRADSLEGFGFTMDPGTAFDHPGSRGVSEPRQRALGQGASSQPKDHRQQQCQRNRQAHTGRERAVDDLQNLHRYLPSLIGNRIHSVPEFPSSRNSQVRAAFPSLYAYSVRSAFPRRSRPRPRAPAR